MQRASWHASRKRWRISRTTRDRSPSSERPGPRSLVAFGGLAVSMSELRALRVFRAGRVPYADGLALQDDLVRRRRSGEIPDTLVLLEHPHVITMGSSTDVSHVLVDEEERTRLGIELHKAGRGGDVTYHGPGQLVAYPILDLKPDRKDLHRYLRDLETVLIRLAAEYGIESERDDAGTGVWTETGKLAAIGIRVSSGWITSHGIALNVDADLSYFDTIVPCGISNRDVTSLARELDRPSSVSEAGETFIRHFCDVFDRHIAEA